MSKDGSYHGSSAQIIANEYYQRHGMTLPEKVTEVLPLPHACDIVRSAAFVL